MGNGDETTPLKHAARDLEAGEDEPGDTPGDVIHAAFDKYDINHDGALSVEEFITAMIDARTRREVKGGGVENR